MILGISVLGILIGFAAWAFWRRKAPKATIWSALLLGGILGGVLGPLLGTLVNLVIGLVGTATSRLVGLGSSAIITAVVVFASLELFGNALAGKKAKPQRWHVGLALALPTIAVAAGFTFLTQGLSLLRSAAGIG